MFKYKIDEELDLRILELRNADEVFNLINKNREYLSKWLPWVEGTIQVGDTKGFIQSELNRYAKNNGFSSGIFYNDKFVGCIGIHEINWIHKKTSIGYWIGEEFQGLGIMTRACKHLTNYLIEELGINRVEIRACMENYKSRAIPERLGYKLEGIRQAELINNCYFDHVVYGMISEEWNNIA